MPSWRFFDSSEASAYLFYRLGTEEPWRAVDAATREPGGWSLLWNPRGNAQLAEYIVIDGCLREAEEYARLGATESLSESVGYRLVLKLLARRVPEIQAGARFQFKIAYVECRLEGPEVQEDALVSKWEKCL